MYWNKTITVLNKYEDNSTGLITYYKTVLNNCFWKETNNEVSVGNVKLQSNSHIIRIPYNSSYLPPMEWLSADQKATKFTLKQGDILIKGTTDFEFDEMTAGKRLNDFLSLHPYGICNIVSVNENIDLPNKHYFVRGD